MQLYNRELEQIENNSRKNRMNLLVEQVIEFLVNEYGMNRQFLQEKAEKIAFVERNSNESHFVEYNGRKKEIKEGRDGASFVTHKKQDYDKDKWNFENAIYTSDTNLDHTIRHEIFHYFSNILSMEFNENGIGYDKSGVQIVGYDKSDKMVDNSIEADGLNEGITELLSQKVDKSSSLENSYAYQVIIADILISNKDKSLIKAYFSKDEKVFRNFLKELGKRQSTISSEDLVKLSVSDSFDNINKDLLKGCIEYSLSFCTSKEEFESEKNRLDEIVENIGIADYRDGVNTKQYLLSAIENIEKNIKDNTLETGENFIINEYGEIIRDNNSKIQMTDIEMATLPNGINIPRKQYEQEYGTEKDARGQVQEQTIGKSQEQWEREQKDKEADDRTQMQNKKSMLTQTYQSTQIRQEDVNNSFETIQQTQREQKQQNENVLDSKRAMFSLSPEQRRLNEQHQRYTNQIQVEQLQNDAKKKKGQGQGMGR